MPLPLILGAAAAALPQIFKGISGIFQTAQGKKLARNNPFQTEAVNQNLIRNSAEADQMAQQGMPSQQYNNQLQSIAKNQAGGVRLLTRSNNPSSGVSSMVRAGNEATGLLNAQDAAQQMQNRRIAMQQRGILANEENRIFDVNKRQRYMQNAQAASEYMRTGRANTFGALDGLSSIGVSALGGGQGGGQASMAGQSSMYNFGGTGYNMPTTPSLNSNYDPNEYNLNGGRPPVYKFRGGY